MKKQFFRVKQLADQRFSRAEKTEVLSYDLLGTEKRVEFFRNVCSTGKKLSSPSLGAGHDIDKRLKKNPEHLLGHSLIELASRHDDDHLLRQIVTDCGKIQLTLGQSIVSHEINVENKIIEPLLNVCDNDYPNIQKQKKSLSKLILDMDSAKTRYLQAAKHGNTAPGSKVDVIKEEWEDAEAKVDQCRDALACEIFQLLSKEAELSATLLQYVILQKQHHDTASAFLNEVIVEMEETILNSCSKKVFGIPLEDHLRVTNRKIAYPIELCVCGIIALTGIAEEGLFRVTPGALKMKRMKLSLDANCLQLNTALTEYRDPHVFAGVLKSYLRELPEPLLTNKLYDQWMAAARIVTTGNLMEGLNALRNVVHSLPQANFDNLHYLIKFFSSLANSKETNKMTPQNIAIVLAPNLISHEKESESLGMNMNVASLHSMIVVTLVTHADFFFPGEMEFFLTLQFNKDDIPHNGVQNENTESHSTDMKRAQSNDSLSDHNSPPHGSPKPAVRSRKHKSTAPTPPVLKYKDDKHSDDKNKDKKKLKDERPKSRLFEEVKPEKLKCDKKVDTKEKKEDAETQTISKLPEPKLDTSLNLSYENIESIDTPLNDSDSDRLENIDLERKLGNLDKRTSKSGEDVRKVKYPQEGMYATMDRKKPPRPTPAPRTFIDGDKTERPAIPERPANLQRPQSLSFRMIRPTMESPEGEGRSLERAHMYYSSEKKQVAIVQIPSDKVPTDGSKIEPRERRESGEKPEKPRKPDSLTSQSGHQRAASEGSIIDTEEEDELSYIPIVELGFERRPPRPTPPPPPSVASPTRKESTDL